MGFSRQEYWSGVPFPPTGDLFDPGIEPTSPGLAGGFFAKAPPGKPVNVHKDIKKAHTITEVPSIRQPHGFHSLDAETLRVLPKITQLPIKETRTITQLYLLF